MRHWLYAIGLMLGLGLGACAPVGRLAPDDAALLRAADSARIAAMLSADPAALERVLAEELRYGHSNGIVQGKAEFVTALSTHEIRYRSIVTNDLQAQRYGAAGVVTASAEVVVEQRGVTHRLALRYLATYVERAGRWQLAAYQSTALPAPP